jgi:hypothetical protein
MRAVVIGILALLVGGCAAPAFDLVSRDPESPWLTGNRWVRTESSRATVSTSFDHTLADHLVFEVEVVNQSDSTLVVDPERFSYTLSSSGPDLPARLRRSVAAVAPATVVARLDREVSRIDKEYERGTDQGLLITAIAGAVLIAAVALDLIEFGAMGEPQVSQVEVTAERHPVSPRRPGPTSSSTSHRRRRRIQGGCATATSRDSCSASCSPQASPCGAICGCRPGRCGRRSNRPPPRAR